MPHSGVYRLELSKKSGRGKAGKTTMKKMGLKKGKKC
jgi:hypothetical protein